MNYSRNTVRELKEICKARKIKGITGKNKQELIAMIEGPVQPSAPIGLKPPVLELCKVPDCVNIEMLKKHMSDYMGPRLAYYRKKNRALFVEDEMAEFFIAEATDGTEIGAGHCAMDVQKDSAGIDAMCVIMNTYASNEKSLIQEFSSSGVDLDTIFKDGKDAEAVELYRNAYSKKIQEIMQEKKLTDLYIVACVSNMTSVSLVCFKIHPENIAHVSSGGFVGNHTKTNISIHANNLVDPAYGRVKLYKSKKRVELRLLPNILTSEYAVKIYSMA
jgi:hypothetical protein